MSDTVDIDQVRGSYMSGNMGTGHGDGPGSLAEAFGATPVSDAPDWLHREAANEENWEVVEKRALEVSAYARDFARKFPLEAFAGVYQVDRASGQKSLTKSGDDVLLEAYEWLAKKCGDNVDKVKAVVGALDLPDEYRTYILARFSYEKEKPARDAEQKAVEDADKYNKAWNGTSASPNMNLHNMRAEDQATAEEVSLDARQKQLAESAKKRAPDYAPVLEVKRVVGGYGIIASDSATQLWKKGELVREISTDEFGGIGVIADEMKALQTAEDVEALFGVTRSRVATGWLRPEAKVASATPTPAAPDVKTNATEAVTSSTVVPPTKLGSRVIFRAGKMLASGTLSNVEGEDCTVLVDGSKTEVSLKLKDIRSDTF